MSGRTSWLARRLAGLVLTLLLGSFAVYGAMYAAPGDPAALLVGGSRPSPEALAAARAEFHLDDPLPTAYANWLFNAVQGDFGRSLVNRAPAAELISSRAGDTLALVAFAALVVILGGLVLGGVAGWRGGRLATAITAFTTVLMAGPTFAVAVVLITVFAFGLGWFPAYGVGSGGLDTVWHLTLPAFALGFAWLAYVASITQEAIAREVSSEHVETARSRGFSRMEIFRRHVLRNASGPILAVNGLSLVGMLASTAVAERAFGVQGLGALLVESAARGDIVVVQAITLIFIAVFVLVNSAVDVLSAALDPRLRAGGTPG